MEEKEQEDYIIYKINTKNFYKVYKSSHGGKDYYKVMIAQKNYDNTEDRFYKQISFKKNLTPPDDGALIRIKKGIENLYTNNIDKYNPISSILVLEYELKEDKEKEKAKAYDEFGQNLAENEGFEQAYVDDIDF